MKIRVILSFIVIVVGVSSSLCAEFVEEIERLHRLDRLPEYRSQTRVEQISSYDRTGMNDDGFSGKHSYIRKEGDSLVLAELEGPGVVHRIWTPTPTDSLMEFYFDGEAEPRISIPFSDLFSGRVFPFVPPVSGHEVGGYYTYVPIPYSKSLKIVYLGPNIQFHQIQYRKLAPGETIESYTPEWSEDARAALERANQLWARSGESVAQESAPPDSIVKTKSGTVKLRAGHDATIFRAWRGGRIVGIELSPSSTFAGPDKDVIFRASWDGEEIPAINSPISDLFGFAFGQPSAKSLLVGSHENMAYCYLPMPYDSNAKLELIYASRTGGGDQPEIEFDYNITYAPERRNAETEGKLYAVRRHERPELGKPYLMLDAQGRGHFVGCFHQAQGINKGMTLFFEGDDVTTVDGELRIHGTGSEDAYNGGWYALPDRWDMAHSLPLHGCLDYSIPSARTGGFRFQLSDKVSFEKSFNMSIEHGGEKNSVPVEYTSVAFYYGDSLPSSNFAGSLEGRTVWYPSEHEYWLQLLPIMAFSHGAKIEYKGWRSPEKVWYESLNFTPAGQDGLIKFELEVPIAGEYELFLSYLKGPNAGIFRPYQRQAPVGEAVDAYAESPAAAIEQPCGVLHFEAGKNSLTIQVQGKNEKATGADFMLHRILLKRK